MITVLTDFGTPLQVADKMARSSGRVLDARKALEEIAIDMVRVTGVLWRSQGRRGGKSWKPLEPATVARKGTNRILYTAGSDPRYTPHPGSDILADSVTKIGGAHQILTIRARSIEFGTDLVYGRRQFATRPFIQFLPSDKARWARIIEKHILEPFTTGTGTTGTVRAPAGGTHTSVQAIGGGFMLRGGNPANIGQFSGVYGR